jgi:hypothetical protein
MARIGKNTLLKIKLLIGEGKDEQNFLNALLKHMGIADIQVEEYGGKSKLSQYLAEFRKRPGRSKVRAIGITRDVDKALSQDFQSVCQILTSFQFSVPANPGDIAPGKLAIGVFMHAQGYLRICVWMRRKATRRWLALTNSSSVSATKRCANLYPRRRPGCMPGCHRKRGRICDSERLHFGTGGHGTMRLSRLSSDSFLACDYFKEGLPQKGKGGLP